MKIDEFKAWLRAKEIYKNEKLVKDCVSRANRVERAFQAINSSFSFESEYEKDIGVSFQKLISRRGVDIKDPVDLPIGTNQMDSIVSAAKKYFVFLADK